MVYADDQLRSHWNLGLVEGVMVGADGEIRAANVRVNKKGTSSVLNRPIQHLYPLEVRRSAEEDDHADIPDPDEVCTEPQTELSTPRQSRRAFGTRARDRILAQAISESPD